MPLIGASVYVTADDLKKVGNNQSTIGVITNIDGQFSISIPEGVTRFYVALDVSSEIAALQGMLANDGLTGEGLR